MSWWSCLRHPQSASRYLSILKSFPKLRWLAIRTWVEDEHDDPFMETQEMRFQDRQTVATLSEALWGPALREVDLHVQYNNCRLPWDIEGSSERRWVGFGIP